jgi:hypothetical protein
VIWSEAHRDNHRFLELRNDDGDLVASACTAGGVWDCAVLIRSKGAIASVIEWTMSGDWTSDGQVRAWCESRLWHGHRNLRDGKLPLRVAEGRPLPPIRPGRRKKRDELAGMLPWFFLRGAA